MVCYFMKIVGCRWTAIHNNIHNSTVLIIVVVSLIPVVSLLLCWVCCYVGFVIVLAFASGIVVYHSWVFFGVFFVCADDIVNMVTLMLQICHVQACGLDFILSLLFW